MTSCLFLLLRTDKHRVVADGHVFLISRRFAVHNNFSCCYGSGCQVCNSTRLIRYEAGMVMVFPPEGVRSIVDGVS